MTCQYDFASKAGNRIKIQQLSESADAYGGQTTGWADLFEVWAAITPYSGREIFASQQVQVRIATKMVIRFRADFSDVLAASKCRVWFGGRTYNIASVNNLGPDLKEEGRAFHALYCAEGEPS